jgi:nitrogen fixation protein NifU and related proteins
MPVIDHPGKRFSIRVNRYVSVFPELGCSRIEKSCLQTPTHSCIEVYGVSRDTPAMYSDAVLDHFQNPRNPGTLEAPSASISVENPVCGDILELSARMEAGRIAEARFRTRGCVTALACSSLLTEMLLGKTPAEARGITSEQISEALGGLPPATLHGAQLARDAVQALLAKLA